MRSLCRQHWQCGQNYFFEQNYFFDQITNLNLCIDFYSDLLKKCNFKWIFHWNEIFLTTKKLVKLTWHRSILVRNSDTSIWQEKAVETYSCVISSIVIILHFMFHRLNLSILSCSISAIFGRDFRQNGHCWGWKLQFCGFLN